MRIKKYIPNTLTCLSLFSGCVACVAAFSGNYPLALLWIVIAAVFDFSDGFAARALKAFSPIGKELDSLSDIVSFGVAPGMMLFCLLRDANLAFLTPAISAFIPYLAFVIPVFSGLRLAKFNIDDRQTTSFIGLPVPAHALFWSSLICVMAPIIWRNPTLYVPILLVVAFASSYMLVSNLPMFSLKFKNFGWKGNEIRYLLIVAGLVFILLFRYLGIAGTIVLYVILSFFNKKR